MCHPQLRAFVLIGVLAASGCYGGGSGSDLDYPAKAPITYNLTEAVVSGAFIVEPRTFKPFKITLTPGMTNARLVGAFSATGARNDIEVTLLTEAQFANWQNRDKFEAAYASGRVTSGKIEVSLPGGPGTYYVVFSNRFSIISNKGVTADVQLVYDQQS
jgi:hypothetical protein